MSLAQAFAKVRAAVSANNPHLGISNVTAEDGLLLASNGEFTVAAKLDSDFEFTVKGKALEDALKKLGDGATFKLEDDALVVGRGRYRSKLKLDTQPPSLHSPNVYAARMPIPDGFWPAFERVAPFMGTDRTRLQFCAVLCGIEAVYATNNVSLIMADHEPWEDDIELLVPDWVVEYLIARDDKPSHVSYDDKQLCFWWQREDWLCSSRIAQAMPDSVSSMCASVTRPRFEITSDWREAFEVISSFATKGELIIGPSRMSSGSTDADTEADIETNVDKDTFWDARFLGNVIRVATHVDFTQWPQPGTFVGHRCRGLFVGRR